MLYKVVRHFFNSDRKRTVKSGLYLEEVKAHCNSPEASSRTCTTEAGKRCTRKYGEWFDGWTEDR